MRIIAAIEADFERTFLGTRSRLGDALRGEAILRRTVRRVRAAGSLASVHVLVPTAQADVARTLLDGLDVQIETHDAAPVPWRNYLAAARKWSLDAWRGGLGGTCTFDEYLNPWLLDALARRESADGVVCVPPAAVLIDPQLLDTVIEHFVSVRDDVRLAFTQSAPGLTAPVYMPALLADLASAIQPIGRVMAYRPAEPLRDMVMQPCFYSADPVVMHTTGRCIADTDGGVERIASILEACGEDVDALGAARWLAQHAREPGRLPGEIEIELTTDDPLAASPLRPRGAALQRSGRMSSETFGAILEQLAGRDDVRLVLGGFGDPLRHPEWPALVQRARSAGVLGLAIRTAGLDLSSDAVHALTSGGVDVVNVLVDATTPATYRQLHGVDGLETVTAGIEQLIAATVQPRAGGLPIVVPEMLKTRATMGELEAFYDTWLVRAGAAVIAGPSHYAGQWPDHAVMNMAPPARFACNRIAYRATILSDGRMTVCDQDFRGSHALGNVHERTIADLWSGAFMQDLRAAHASGVYDRFPLCPRCDEWHRP